MVRRMEATHFRYNSMHSNNNDINSAAMDVFAYIYVRAKPKTGFSNTTKYCLIRSRIFFSCCFRFCSFDSMPYIISRVARFTFFIAARGEREKKIVFNLILKISKRTKNMLFNKIFRSRINLLFWHSPFKVYILAVRSVPHFFLFHFSLQCLSTKSWAYVITMDSKQDEYIISKLFAVAWNT